MLIKRIYRGNRGEGKTKWLVENAIDSVVISGQHKDETTKLFYIGDVATYDNFVRTYENAMHTKCPIERWDHKDMRGCDSAILFTDELMYNISCIPDDLPSSGIWFITMDNIDFVNN